MSRSTDFHRLTWRTQVNHLRQIVEAILPQFEVDVRSFRLLKYHFDAIFRVIGQANAQYVLRVFPFGSATATQVQSEMLWLQALRRDTNLRAPEPLATRDGGLVACLEETTCCLLTWVPGVILRKRLTPATVASAGEITAQLHQQARQWTKPLGFQRPIRDINWLVGPESILSRPQEWTSLDSRASQILGAALGRVVAKLRPLGDGADVLGLTHADVHDGNFVLEKGELGLIDFDDCCWGYWLHDLATMLLPLRRVEDGALLAAAYLRGYERRQPLPLGFNELIPLFLAFRELLDVKVVLESRNQWVRAKRPIWLQALIGGLEEYLVGRFDEEAFGWRDANHAR